MGVKASQFSFNRLQNADPVLGVDMSSTGEVGCLGDTFEEALLNSLIATGYKIPAKSQGIMLSSDASFETVTYAVNDTVEANYTLYVTGLQELTKYYVRAYAIGKNGVTIYSETKEVTTVAAPMVSIEGTYTVVDYKNGDSGWEQFCNPYKMTIEFEEGSNDIVNITGLALGSIDRYSETEPVTFQGLYDAETNTITIPNNSVVANTADYGQVWSVAYQADALVLNFNPKGDSMESQIVRYACAAGNLGYFYHEMQHD
jgi:hypothetical protein